MAYPNDFGYSSTPSIHANPRMLHNNHIIAYYAKLFCDNVRNARVQNKFLMKLHNETWGTGTTVVTKTVQ